MTTTGTITEEKVSQIWDMIETYGFKIIFVLEKISALHVLVNSGSLSGSRVEIS